VSATSSAVRSARSSRSSSLLARDRKQPRRAGRVAGPAARG
jgi:hypothetical protein